MPYFFLKLEKMLQNLSSAAVVIGALRVKMSITKWNLKKKGFFVVAFFELLPYANLAKIKTL